MNSAAAGTPYQLEIGGMTCASCAARIEKRLNRMEGVTAAVNYATEKAHVEIGQGVAVDDLIAEVVRTGYAAALPREEQAAASDPTSRALRRRLVIAGTLSVPVIALAMAPPLQFPGWQWVSLVLATPVVTWAAWPFHRAALVNARHRAATMDTLISVGVTAAYLWSLYALFFGTAGMWGMTHPFRFTIERGDGLGSIYLEVAAGVTTFLLLGQFLEQRSKRRAGAALRALGALGAKDVAILRDGVEVRLPLEQLRVGDVFTVRPGEKVATDGVVREGGIGGRRLHAHRRADARRGASRGRRDRGDRQHRGAARRLRDPRRCRHPARPDGAPRGAGAVGKGRGPASR